MKNHLYLFLLLLSPVFVFSQNVGIGTTMPLMKLHVTQTGSSVLLLENTELLGIGVNTSMYFKTGNGSYPYTGSIKTIGTSTITARLGLFTYAADSVNGLIERMSILNNGNVGIGLTFPKNKLEVEGGIKADSLDLNSGLIKNVADPKSAQDATTKAYVDSISSPTHVIGLSAEQGGYIFWVSSDGKHGLVADTIDQGYDVWYEAQNLISNPSNHSADGENFRDWRMPTKYELDEMYLQKEDIGGFTVEWYWSSTENDGSNAWLQNFGTGNQVYDVKDVPYVVRAVRAF